MSTELEVIKSDEAKLFTCESSCKLDLCVEIEDKTHLAAKGDKEVIDIALNMGVDDFVNIIGKLAENASYAYDSNDLRVKLHTAIDKAVKD
ncbi:hypothetical protein GR7B_00216 [Vibrio phage vB_VcorM_GR7B]|nr:hypothetical protein GR7B_00216 [Vibrio phage vB_VcorM_GR7B]